MNKKDFDTIIYVLDKHIEDCKTHLDNILTTSDLENITIKQLLELREFCRKESNEMTEICMVDFYHVIGMGDLTVIQQNTFIKKMKEYMSYRSDIKCISTMKELDSLPKLPSASSFTLKRLGSILLTSKIRGRGEAAQVFNEECEVADYHIAKAESKLEGLEYNTIKLVNNVVTFKLEDLALVAKLIQSGTGCKTDTIMMSARTGKHYCEVSWAFTDTDKTEMKGTILSVSRVDSFRDKLKNEISKSLDKEIKEKVLNK